MKQLLTGLYDNSSRWRLSKENADFAATVPPGGVVLDAGSGEAPYRSLFQHATFETADFQKVDKPYANATYVCDLASLPIDDDRFDAIIFNQVPEHVPDPKRVLAELYRVLKPGGRMLYTGPLFYEEHEQPYDFYRYTQFGLRYLFTEAGFAVERLDWLEGYFGTVAYQLKGMSRDLPSMPAQLGGGVPGLVLAPALFLVKVGCFVGSAMFHRLERRAKFQKRGYPKNYVAVVAKGPSAAR